MTLQQETLNELIGNAAALTLAAEETWDQYEATPLNSESAVTWHKAWREAARSRDTLLFELQRRMTREGVTERTTGRITARIDGNGVLDLYNSNGRIT